MNCKYCMSPVVEFQVTRLFGLDKLFKASQPVKLCPICDRQNEDQELPATVGAASLRCRWCERRWPPKEEFTRCPICREPTKSETYMAPSMASDVAHEDLIQFAFGWFLWDRGLL